MATAQYVSKKGKWYVRIGGSNGPLKDGDYLLQECYSDSSGCNAVIHVGIDYENQRPVYGTVNMGPPPCDCGMVSVRGGNTSPDEIDIGLTNPKGLRPSMVPTAELSEKPASIKLNEQFTNSTVIATPENIDSFINDPINNLYNTNELMGRERMGLSLSNNLPINVGINTPNLEQIQLFPVVGRGADGIHFHQDPITGQMYRMTSELHSSIQSMINSRKVFIDSNNQSISNTEYTIEVIPQYDGGIMMNDVNTYVEIPVTPDSVNYTSEFLKNQNISQNGYSQNGYSQNGYYSIGTPTVEYILTDTNLMDLNQSNNFDRNDSLNYQQETIRKTDVVTAMNRSGGTSNVSIRTNVDFQDLNRRPMNRSTFVNNISITTVMNGEMVNVRRMNKAATLSDNFNSFINGQKIPRNIPMNRG